jgi:hypothetical protein
MVPRGSARSRLETGGFARSTIKMPRTSLNAAVFLEKSPVPLSERGGHRTAPLGTMRSPAGPLYDILDPSGLNDARTEQGRATK